MRAYYNEIDAYCCAWLSNLMDAGHITRGRIDDRSIIDVSPDDVRGYERCHFFAGIGGWDLAVAMSGYDGPIWTGSPPCQPFSSACRGQSARQDDKRNFAHYWAGIIGECRPFTVFGEQTAQAGDWFDSFCDEVEALDYSVGAAILPAASVGLDHARHRLFFVCHANEQGEPSGKLDEKMAGVQWDRGLAGGMVSSDGISARMAQLCAFGNAIVPQVAAEFIKAATNGLVS